MKISSWTLACSLLFFTPWAQAQDALDEWGGLQDAAFDGDFEEVFLTDHNWLDEMPAATSPQAPKLRPPSLPFYLSASYREAPTIQAFLLTAGLRIPFGKLSARPKAAQKLRQQLGPSTTQGLSQSQALVHESETPSQSFNSQPGLNSQPRLNSQPGPTSQPQVGAQPSASRIEQAPAGSPPSEQASAPSNASKLSPSRQLSERCLLHAFFRELLEQSSVASGLANSQERLDSLVRRARWSGLAPDLRLRGMHGLDSTTSLEQTAGYLGESVRRDGYDALVEARLTFHLGRLVFADEEPAFERQRESLLKLRRELQRELVKNFADWLRLTRLRSQAEELAWLPEDQLEADMQEMQARLTLDSLSGGWFSLALPLLARHLSLSLQERAPAPLSAARSKKEQTRRRRAAEQWVERCLP